MGAASASSSSPGRLGLLLRRPLVRAAVCLAIILAVASWLRLTAIAFDRPYVYHPDEWAIATPAMNIVATGDTNPHVFLYPSLLVYVETAVVEVVHEATDRPLVFKAPRGPGGLYGDSLADFSTMQYAYVVWGRRVVAGFGVLLALMVALAGWAAARARPSGSVASSVEARASSASSDGARPWLAGLFGAAFVALAVLPIDHSRFLTTDVPAAFFTSAVMVATLLAIYRAPDRTSDRLLILAGFLSGLAASTKYNAVVVVMVPAMGYLVRAGSLRALPSWLRRGLLSPVPPLMAAGLVVGFVVATPAILTDTDSVVSAVQFQVFHYNTEGHIGAQGDTVGYYVHYLWYTGFGPVLSILAAGGVVWALVRHRAADLILAGFAITYFILVSLPTVRFERNLMPMVPFIALLAGRLVADAVMALRGRLASRPRPIGMLAAAGLIAALSAQPLAMAMEDMRIHSRPDTRTIAVEWIETNLPDGTTIVRETYTPQPNVRRYRVGWVLRLCDHDLAWYRANGYSYAIASSGEYARYLTAGTESQAAIYRQLLSLPVVYSIEGSATIQGPRIVIVDLQSGP
jgi:hypothetical protein